MKRWRAAGRAGTLLLVAAFVVVVAVQFERIIVRNIEASRRLASARNEVARLGREVAREERDLRRLRDPRGSAPEIHERLEMVGPKEEIIYLKGAPPSPPAWEAQ